MTARNINKQLICMEDVAQGVGFVSQMRSGEPEVLGRVDIPYSVNTEENMKLLDITRFNRARVYDGELTYADYLYSETDLSGISSLVGSGTWIRISDSGTASSDLQPAEGDSTELLTNAINSLRESGGTLRLAPGDFVISAKLPVYSAVKILGSGMPYYQGYWLDIVSVEESEGRTKFFIDDPDNRLSHRIMSGDVVKIINTSKHTGTQEVFTVDPVAKSVTIFGTFGSGVNLDSDAQMRLSILGGGTIIRFQNPETGEVTDGERFFDESDIRNFSLHFLGFVGPGVNSVFGGGMRFRRQNGPDGVSRAITGYDWSNVLLAHASMDAVRFDQLIHSRLSHMVVNRCTGDALLFQAGPEGGATTSVRIDTCYMQNVRRGIAFYTAAYCTLSNCVVEGSSLGYYVNRGIGMSFSGMGTETIKFDSAGQSGGTSFLFVDGYGITLDSLAVYYNTEEAAWSKAAVVFTDPNKRTESPCAAVTGGHIHWSLGPKIPVIATRWSADRIGRIYVDVSADSGYEPPEGDTGSSWIGNSFWDDSILIQMTGVARDPLFNYRYKVDSMTRTPYISSGANIATSPPTATDDSNSGYTAFESFWFNSSEGNRSGRYVCIDDTVGAARWVKTEETYEIDFEARDSNPLSKQAEPVGSEGFVFRLGRNYGVDLATDNIQRVLSTSSSIAGEFECCLDITHLHPVRYSMTVNYDPYLGNSTSEYIVKSIDLENVNGTDYIAVELIVGDDGDGSAHDDLFVDALNEDGDPIEVRYSDNGPTTVTIPSKRRLSLSTTNMILYFTASDYFSNGDSLNIFNCMLPEMDGEWTVSSSSLTEKSGVPCVSLVCLDRAIRTNIIDSVDYGVYVADKWSAPISTEVSISGLDHLYIYDEANAVGMKDSREGFLTVAQNTTTTTLQIPAANNYNFRAYFSQSSGQVWVTAQDFTSVTFTHTSQPQNEEVVWQARRKKNPTVLSIYDRN